MCTAKLHLLSTFAFRLQTDVLSLQSQLLEINVLYRIAKCDIIMFLELDISLCSSPCKWNIPDVSVFHAFCEGCRLNLFFNIVLPS